MGIVRRGPPHDLILLLRDALGLHWFIETGTFLGETAAWAAGHFERVVTFELSEPLHAQAFAAHGHLTNVEFRSGDSRAGLRELVSSLEGPACVWLDSHWSGGDTYGLGDECPLLDELKTIASSTYPHVVLIDDARLFESAPPRPHDPEQWPAIDEVIDLLTAARPRPFIAIVEDVIVAVPPQGRPLLVSYCQEVNTRAWEQLQRGGDGAPAPYLIHVLRRIRRLLRSGRRAT